MNEKVLALLAQYDGLLADIPAVQVEDASAVYSHRLGHCRWMIAEMREKSSEWSTRKVNRWLGFIQGVLWSSGLYGIKDLRDQSRDLYD